MKTPPETVQVKPISQLGHLVGWAIVCHHCRLASDPLWPIDGYDAASTASVRHALDHGAPVTPGL